jgi:5-methyltetrahydrofolate--homocysteine methyltransferase
MISIEDLLQHKHLLFDGAMGTSIQKLGLSDVDPLELMSLNYPDKLEQIHREYIQAGSKVIETNTFGGSRARLELGNNEAKVREINIAAAKIAKKVALNKAFVAGSVGPTGLLIEPYGDTPREKVLDYFTEQIEALLDGGVDLILIETMISLDEALIALEAANKMGSKLTGITMTFEKGQQGIRTSFGESPVDACKKLEENGAHFIGSNCGHGFNDMIMVAKELRSTTDLPILIQPNAGIPVVSDGKIIYEESPEMFAQFVEQIIDVGIEFIGGCCGTTVEHIRKAAQMIKSKTN